MATLYLVSTPIGNRKDITLRAIETLFASDFIACEDTRKTRKLLNFYRSSKGEKIPQLISYYEENEEKRIPEIIKSLKEGKNISLVSNAGTPAISDPGFKLIRRCIKEGIKVEAIPGASAILTALVISGLPTDKFLFLGYLPKKQSKRRKILKSLPANTTVILFESPHRLLRTLREVQEVLGEIKLVVCRELTKIHEEIRREKINQSIEHFEKTKPKGEFTLLFSLTDTPRS